MLAARRVRKTIRNRRTDSRALLFGERCSSCYLVLFDKEPRFFWTRSARHVEVLRVGEMGGPMPDEVRLLVKPEAVPVVDHADLAILEAEVFRAPVCVPDHHPSRRAIQDPSCLASASSEEVVGDEVQ